jgi:hypothetical protein
MLLPRASLGSSSCYLYLLPLTGIRHCTQPKKSLSSEKQYELKKNLFPYNSCKGDTL